MNKKVLVFRKPIIILIIGIFIGVFLLKWQASVIPVISYADGVSYISAAGNQGYYEHNTLTGTWVHASQWKEFWKESSFFQFDKIRYDIAHYDIHPPLYFWILHIWSYIVGIDLSTGPILNIFFHVLTSILIFIICRRLQCSYLIAVAAGLLWLLNGSIVSAAQETRQYSLLALCSVLYLWCLLAYLQKKSVRTLIYLTIAAVLGMLTHYHFGLLVSTSVMYVAIYMISKKNWVHLFRFVVALGIAALIFFMIHPEFYVSFERQVFQAQAFSVENMIPRAINCRNTIIELFKPKIPIGWLQKLALFIAFTGSVILGIKYTKKQKNKVNSLKHFFRTHKGLPIFAVLIITSISFALYIFQYSPLHAMNVKYMMLVVPIYFILIGQFFHLVIPQKLMAYMFIPIIIFQTIDTSINIKRYEINSKKLEKAISENIATGTPIILDSSGRGVLPRILWHVDDNTNVYATTQSNLISEFPELKTYSHILYVSNLEYHGNNLENQMAILEKFDKQGYKLKGEITNLVNSKIFLLIKTDK
ncbi:glycosyltransferase family 39 protein [Yeosuana sp. MJ-SS3]|uniref:Glycosyltransferase family 39 protein n=1 Tax=Gilvirhabdus luticola TaxID=3079858 RepID=A0ABU3U505_9FLAO|nr:glycosyltransferase family 39 protein [Yeosuana sp. MJ-SS3]MDU8885490.1 glycosyltransferase family 39 protein [Yeosuana sp. MJ-SS3]